MTEHWKWLVALVVFSGCATTPPSNINNVCEIFKEKPDWYADAKKAEKRWGTPVAVQMAIIHQESAFRDDAQPARRRILGVVPWTRPSSAYGYPQAKDDTWDWYIRKTGNRGADRDDFADATDFIGWYTDVSYRTLGISKWNARQQYLAYHEGHGGYKRKTYRNKAWLLKVADKVERQSRSYFSQLKACEDKLDSSSSWFF